MYKWIALLAGFCLMAFELVAARLLAPTIGSSTFIWTNVIGVIMAALAVGYWLGGKLADKRKRESDIVRLCLITAGIVTLVLLFHGPVIDLARDISSDARWQGLIAAILLFAPTSVVIGMLSPYLAKLAVKTTKETGETVARLSTFNAIGSIVGTFLTGFVLFGVIGSRATLVVVIVGMLIASWLINPKARIWHKVAICVALMFAVLISMMGSDRSIINIDTATSHYRVTKDTVSNHGVTYLSAGPRGIQSGVLDAGEKTLLFWYTQEIASVVENYSATKSPEHILILGGGAFTLPEYLGKKYPDAHVDVVEIDPELEAISAKHFRFEKPTNVSVFAEDARSYVNRIKDTTYDVVILDIFTDADIPWQFITRQFGEKLASLISDQGIIIANTISAETDGCRAIVDAFTATFAQHHPYVYAKSKTEKPGAMANREIVFSRTAANYLDDYNQVKATNLRTYTDDFAPIEHLQQSCLNSAKS